MAGPAAAATMSHQTGRSATAPSAYTVKLAGQSQPGSRP